MELGSGRRRCFLPPRLHPPRRTNKRPCPKLVCWLVTSCCFRSQRSQSPQLPSGLAPACMCAACAPHAHHHMCAAYAPHVHLRAYRHMSGRWHAPSKPLARLYLCVFRSELKCNALCNALCNAVYLHVFCSELKCAGAALLILAGALAAALVELGLIVLLVPRRHLRGGST